MRRTFLILVPVLTCALGLAGCTNSSHPAPPDTTVTQTETLTHSPSVIPTTPVVAGPTTSAVADCPLISQADAMPIIGQRLDHASVQTSGGKVVGCEFFDIYDQSLAASEHLPTPPYPSARITITTYPSPDSAHNALAIASTAGTNPSLQTITGGLVGETYQTTFYPPDGKTDWACAFLKGPKLITVLLADQVLAGQGSVQNLANAIAPKV
jgi:hypothetical protein